MKVHIQRIIDKGAVMVDELHGVEIYQLGGYYRHDCCICDFETLAIARRDLVNTLIRHGKLDESHRDSDYYKPKVLV